MIRNNSGYTNIISIGGQYFSPPQSFAQARVFTDLIFSASSLDFSNYLQWGNIVSGDTDDGGDTDNGGVENLSKVLNFG